MSYDAQAPVLLRRTAQIRTMQHPYAPLTELGYNVLPKFNVGSPSAETSVALLLIFLGNSCPAECLMMCMTELGIGYRIVLFYNACQLDCARIRTLEIPSSSNRVPFPISCTSGMAGVFLRRGLRMDLAFAILLFPCL